ncbi:MAG: hypothetical protein DI587_10950 [Variovorax paradoxus]|nr:MAG: hypothetical protein DI583_10950 [Variovorax paradoxus]PZQ10970.1 MAG: hypothetical protein DI587_10950 [Variovorax paradoxus]
MPMSVEKMQELEQQALTLAQAVAGSKEICEELAMAEMACGATASGKSGSNSSLDLMAAGRDKKFAFSRFATSL